MTVVSDAGPLIALAKIGGLEILHKLYPRILVPPSVLREAVETAWVQVNGAASSWPSNIELIGFW